MLGEVLPYLQLKKDNEETQEIIEEQEVPEIRGLSIKEATKQLKEVGLEIENTFEEEVNKEETMIKEQTPKPGIKVKKGAKITIEI